MKTTKIILIALISALVLPACAERDRIINVNDLPVKAQNFLKNFTGKQTSFIKLEREGMRKEFDVVFTDGSTIEFNADGEWTDVNCRQSAVPAGIVPNEIKNYVKKNYPSATILQIEQYRHGYEIDLSNGLEIEFNKKFQVKNIEN